MSTPQATPTLAQAIRAKYPGTYDDLTDQQLEQKVLAKFPQYGDMPRTPDQPPASGNQESRAAVAPPTGGALASLPAGAQVAATQGPQKEQGTADNVLTGVFKGMGDTVNGLAGIVGAKPPVSGSTESSNAGESVGKGVENIAEFVLGDAALKGLGMAEKLGLAQKATKLAESSPYLANLLNLGMTAARQGTVGAAQGYAKSGGDVGAAAKEGAVTAAIAPVAEGVSGLVGKGVKALRGDEGPGLVEQIAKGRAVAQPGAQQAIRDAVNASAKSAGTGATAGEAEPIISGSRSILDDQINALYAQQKAAYRVVDDAAGFDLKAERAALKNDTYKLNQLGNTDADITQRGNLIEAINDSTDRIAEAEAKLKTAGIDPAEADALHGRYQAAKTIKGLLVKNATPDGSAVNIDGLLNDLKKARFSKLGKSVSTIDRVAQFTGDQASADALMGQLQKMQQLGAHAVKARWIAGILGYEGAKHAIGATGGTAAKIATGLLP